MITQPLLAYNKTPDLDKLTYPIAASPKLDGIRCLIKDGHPVSRTFKNIPNRYIYEILSEANLPENLDGEILTYSEDGKLDVYNDVQSKVMSEDGEPEFLYHVFDMVTTSLNEPFAVRYFNMLNWFTTIKQQGTILYVEPVFQIECKDRTEVEATEAHWLSVGMEGIMLRAFDGPYKCGRSTLNEEILLKLKRFADSEATVVAKKQLFTNINDADSDNFGRIKRSKSQDGMIPLDMLGAITVTDKNNPAWTFDIGTGFTDKQRRDIWNMPDSILIGKTIKYKYQPHGMKLVPRCPVFLGFRDTNY